MDAGLFDARVPEAVSAESSLPPGRAGRIQWRCSPPARKAPEATDTPAPGGSPDQELLFDTLVPVSVLVTIEAVRCCSETSERSWWGLLRFWNPGSVPRLAFLIESEIDPSHGQPLARPNQVVCFRSIVSDRAKLMR